MARGKQLLPGLMILGLLAVQAWTMQVAAQSASTSSADESETRSATADGPLLIPSVPPSTAADTTLPEPAVAELPEPQPVVTRPPNGRDEELEEIREIPAARRGRARVDDLPPPQEPRLESPQRAEQSSVGLNPILGITLDHRVRDAAVVRTVEPRSPAARAGLERGDVIWAINNQRVASAEDLADIAAEMQRGDVFSVNYSRDVNTRIVLDDPAVRSAGYAEELPSGLSQDETFNEGSTYGGARYREGARFRAVEEDLPAPAYSAADSRRRTLYYAPIARDQRDRYEPRDDRRDDEESDRRLLRRERDSQERPLRNRPLLPWRRN